MARKKLNSVKMDVFFTPETSEQLKLIAEEKGTTVSGLIRMVILEYLANIKKKGE